MLDKIFEITKNNNNFNTAYPIKKELWYDYKVKDLDLFKDEDELSIYIHIPFCQSLCRFCEYVKFKNDKDKEERYMKVLKEEIKEFLEGHKINKLYGFDIGGGTPTSINIASFKELMDIAKEINNLNTVDDFEPSIEATFNTLDEEKVKYIKAAGFKRISLGIQTTNTELLLNNNRLAPKLEQIINTINLIKQYELKVNIDLMYGLIGQKVKDITSAIDIIKLVNPDQVTLYEMRYNRIGKESKFTKKELYNFYKIFYNSFIELGFIANFGQNTFSKTRDLGLSSYLRYRMIYNKSYKGFGISAQSKSRVGLSYNIGKTNPIFEDIIKNNSIKAEDIYLLPEEELLAKYISICLYFGQFNLSIMEDIIKKDPQIYFKEEFDYLERNSYIEIKGDIVKLSKKGFKYYGSVAALFYPMKVKKYIMENKYD